MRSQHRFCYVIGHLKWDTLGVPEWNHHKYYFASEFINNFLIIMLTYTLRVLNQLALGCVTKVNIVKKAGAQTAYEVAFRAWPVDLDTYFHINNACYLRIAELARWRIAPESKMFSIIKDKGIMFLATEQVIKYIKPIQPMQKYIVSTSISYTEDKWFYYNHTFLQHPDDVKQNKEPIIYAIINCKAVLKEKSGKTVRVGELIPYSPLYKELIETDNTQEDMESK